MAVPQATGCAPGARKDHACGERAIATLKTLKILVELPCSRGATAIVQSIVVLHHIEVDRYAG